MVWRDDCFGQRRLYCIFYWVRAEHLIEIYNCSTRTILLSELPYPLVSLSPSSSLPISLAPKGLPNKCSVVLISDLQNLEMVSLLSRQLNQIPSMVILIDSKDTFLAQDWGYQPGLWLKYAPGHKVVSLTCPGSGLVQRGVWTNLSASLGDMNTVCSMRHKQLRIAHNTWPPYFAVKGRLQYKTIFYRKID